MKARKVAALATVVGVHANMNGCDFSRICNKNSDQLARETNENQIIDREVKQETFNDTKSSESHGNLDNSELMGGNITVGKDLNDEKLTNTKELEEEIAKLKEKIMNKKQELEKGKEEFYKRSYSNVVSAYGWLGEDFTYTRGKFGDKDFGVTSILDSKDITGVDGFGTNWDEFIENFGKYYSVQRENNRANKMLGASMLKFSDTKKVQEFIEKDGFDPGKYDAFFRVINSAADLLEGLKGSCKFGNTDIDEVRKKINSAACPENNSFYWGRSHYDDYEKIKKDEEKLKGLNKKLKDLKGE